MTDRVLRPGKGDELRFARVPLAFEPETHTNLFALKNNKTVAQTLVHRRYAGLLSVIPPEYQTALQTPLGDFLCKMKAEGDLACRRFLNKHGDLEYCSFQILEPQYFSAKGVYAYFVRDELKYVGRCKDSMRKRINYGHGNYPKS